MLTTLVIRFDKESWLIWSIVIRTQMSWVVDEDRLINRGSYVKSLLGSPRIMLVLWIKIAFLIWAAISSLTAILTAACSGFFYSVIYFLLQGACISISSLLFDFSKTLKSIPPQTAIPTKIIDITDKAILKYTASVYWALICPFIF